VQKIVDNGIFQLSDALARQMPNPGVDISPALMQLRFASFTVNNFPEDFPLQERTRAGRTKQNGRDLHRARFGFLTVDRDSPARD
jgi:hypothetical protein